MKTGVIAFAMSMSTAISAHPEPSICQRLAGLAEQVPADAWAASDHDPMDQLLNRRPLRESERKRSKTEARLVNDPALRKEFSVGPETALGIERLAGTDVYRIESFQGTANCQSMLFVEASEGQPPHRLPLPFEAQACVTQHGRFGHAFGQALVVVGGQVAMGELARSYTISGWQERDKRWTPPCELKLEFERRLKLSGRYCSAEGPLCKAAATLAPGIAEAFDKRSPLDPLAFANGLEPPEAVLAWVKEESNTAMEFPSFGAKTKGSADVFLTTFSNARAPARLALRIEDTWWLGVVGVAGVGWRESTTSLVVISAMTNTGPVPVASFQVEKIPAGRASAQWH